MMYHVTINRIKTVNEFDGVWNASDFRELLKAFDFEEEDASEDDLKDLLFMAMTDVPPEEAAEIVLSYRLGKQLSANQIKEIANDMLDDNIAEEYADISLHYELFNINQLLFKAFNGTFPNAKATVIEFSIVPKQHSANDITKEIILKAFDATLAEGNVIKRLFDDHLAGKVAFSEAEDILWTLKKTDDNNFIIATSDYWMSKDEITQSEFDAMVHLFED